MKKSYNTMSCHKIVMLVSSLVFFMGCQPKQPNIPQSDLRECASFQARSEIQDVMDKTAACARNRDIDGFMSSCDNSMVLESNEKADSNRVIVKDTLRKDILQSWSIITEFVQISTWIDSLKLTAPDSAVVFTNQFFHRKFSRPNGLSGEDDIVSTQAHREVWIKRQGNWKQTRIKELGGYIYVNGLPYEP
jgi:hypothetical protein